MSDQHQQEYPLWQLVQEVEELLRERGLNPHVPPGKADLAVRGADTLLRAFGLSPRIDSVTSMVLSVNEPWTDRDDRRAASQQ